MDLAIGKTRQKTAAAACGIGQSGGLSTTLGSAQGDFLSIAGLEKVYPSREGAIVALKDVSLSVDSAKFVSLLGPSGCGKSTLLRCIAGLERPTAGTIILHGNTVTAPPEDMGIVFQRDVLLDWLTVVRNILLPARIRRLPLRRMASQGRASA